jgi:hypothetical protein
MGSRSVACPRAIAVRRPRATHFTLDPEGLLLERTTGGRGRRSVWEHEPRPSSTPLMRRRCARLQGELS